MTEQHFDVVVIGGGIIGVSSAYQIALRGVRRVAVLERGSQVAAGSTGQSSAIIRQRYSNLELVRLAHWSLTMFQQWSVRLELPEDRSGFTPAGVVWLSDCDPAAYGPSVRDFRTVGAVGGVYEPAVLRDRYPSLNLCPQRLDLTGIEHTCTEPRAVFWEEQAGFADPQGTTEDLLRAGISRGVKLFLRHEVSAIETTGGRVSAVRCRNGVRFPCGAVLNAAGPWCGRIHAMVSVTLPMILRPAGVEIALRNRPADVVGDVPVFVSEADGQYGRPEARGSQLLVGSTDPADERNFIEDADTLDPAGTAAFRDRMMHKLHHRFAMKSRGTVRGYAALYTVNTVDWHPIVDALGPDGYYVANGFSGHGFKLGPSVGALIGRMITGVARPDDPAVDVRFFAADRRPIGSTGGVLA